MLPPTTHTVHPASRLPVRTPAPAGHASGAAPLGTVATVLTADERLRVDAAGAGLYHTIHRDSLDAVLRDLRQRRAAAVIVSVGRCGEREATSLARVVREFPRVPAVALLSQVAHGTSRTVLRLGNSGVRTLVDVRQASGWQELRAALMTDAADDVGRVALAQIALDLAGARAECLRFFEVLFGHPERVATVRALAEQLDVLPSTMLSRFFRARLPAPKRYLAMARLVQAARLFENPGLSVAAVANHLDYSSPQSFGRHVRTLIGVTALRFRQRYDGEGMLAHFRHELVLPFADVLRHFDPLGGEPGWLKRQQTTSKQPAASSHGSSL